MTIKAFIFDLDGTLLNTIDDLRDSINVTMVRFGHPQIDTAQAKQFIGNGMRLLIQRCLPLDSTEEHLQECLAFFLNEYKQRQMDKTAPYPGIKELLRALNRREVPIGVISNKKNANTQVIIDHYFNDIDFTFVSGEVDGIDPKPDPTLTKHCVAKMNLGFDEVLYIGDTKVDVATGHNAGLKAVGVTWGFRDRQELIDAGADYLIDTPDQLLKILENDAFFRCA